MADKTPNTPNRRARDAAETRENILAVAAREYADKGLAGARIDEIAEKTASSKRMIYYYFGGKDELYRAVLERAYLHIREQEQDARDDCTKHTKSGARRNSQTSVGSPSG